MQLCNGTTEKEDGHDAPRVGGCANTIKGRSGGELVAVRLALPTRQLSREVTRIQEGNGEEDEAETEPTLTYDRNKRPRHRQAREFLPHTNAASWSGHVPASSPFGPRGS